MKWIEEEINYMKTHQNNQSRARYMGYDTLYIDGLRWRLDHR